MRGRFDDNHSNPQYRSQFEYFDLQSKEWMTLPNAATLPHLAFLVVAGRSLYAVVGSDSDHPNEKGFFQYDAKQNRWKQLPSMIGSYRREAFHAVYLNGFIYVIGDQLGEIMIGDQPRNVERYSLTEQRWERLASLPSQFRWTSVIAYEGSILVYDISANLYGDYLSHVIQKYDPRAHAWEVVLLQHVPNDVRYYLRPVLFEYQDQVYRLYKDNEQRPVVNKINTQPSQNGGRWSVGEEINQDLVTGNEIGAFCIQDQIFVNTRGFIQLTDLKMNHGKADNHVLERKWHHFLLSAYSFNVNNFTFDKKKLGWVPLRKTEVRLIPLPSPMRRR